MSEYQKFIDQPAASSASASPRSPNLNPNPNRKPASRFTTTVAFKSPKHLGKIFRGINFTSLAASSCSGENQNHHQQEQEFSFINNHRQQLEEAQREEEQQFLTRQTSDDELDHCEQPPNLDEPRPLNSKLPVWLGSQQVKIQINKQQQLATQPKMLSSQIQTTFYQPSEQASARIHHHHHHLQQNQHHHNQHQHLHHHHHHGGHHRGQHDHNVQQETEMQWQYDNCTDQAPSVGRIANYSPIGQQTRQQPSSRQFCSSKCFHRQHYCSNCKHRPSLASLFNTDDPILLKWLQAMRFETEPECLTSLQARSLAIDEASAGALNVRNSQVAIQEMRLQSDFLLDYIDHLIELLPLSEGQPSLVDKFSSEFTELWLRLTEQTSITMRQLQACGQQHVQTTSIPSGSQHLTIINNCTPKKVTIPQQQQQQQFGKQQQQLGKQQHLVKPLDKLVIQIRNFCMDCAQHLYAAGEATCDGRLAIDDTCLEVSLRKIKEYYGRFVEISIRSHCANIVRSLNYDFTKQSLNRLSSTSSLRPARPFESSSSQLPLKWALIALWQLTKDDSYICRTLNEKWQAAATTTTATTIVTLNGNHEHAAPVAQAISASSPSSAAARSASRLGRLDYSNKYDNHGGSCCTSTAGSGSQTASSSEGHSLRSDYHKLREITMRHHQTPLANGSETNRGALSSAISCKQQHPATANGSQQLSTIELLIGIIISQPNKHERLDIMNTIRTHDQHNKLIDIDEQSVLAAVYTSNQYKVAALRILNHLCVTDQAVKTILKCFSTPPPDPSHPNPENKIIRSIFECYQSSQEHIYQNETMFNTCKQPARAAIPPLAANYGARKRTRQQVQRQQYSPDSSEDFCYQTTQATSDYGSGRHSITSSLGGNGAGATGGSETSTADSEGDDQVVKEAMRLLVQLTRPFSSAQGHDYYTLIGRFSIALLVNYLTNIVKNAASHEMILLSLTVLANISFIATDPIKRYSTNSSVMEMFRTSRKRSRDLQLRDQAVTILANTANKEPLDVVNSGGLTFLLSCLDGCPTKMANFKAQHQQRAYSKLNIENKPRDRRPVDLGDAQYPQETSVECLCISRSRKRLERNAYAEMSPLNLHQMVGNHLRTSSYGDVAGRQCNNYCLGTMNQEELASMERIHQKTGVAIARLSSDKNTTRTIHQLGGLKRLIDLCKNGPLRNHSNTVLMACMTAIRKLNMNGLHRDIFDQFDALDLLDLDWESAIRIYGQDVGDDAFFLKPINKTITGSPYAKDPKYRWFASEV